MGSSTHCLVGAHVVYAYLTYTWALFAPVEARAGIAVASHASVCTNLASTEATLYCVRA